MDFEIIDQYFGGQVEIGDTLIVENNQIIVRTLNSEGADIHITAENLSDSIGQTEFTLDSDTLYDVWMSV